MKRARVANLVGIDGVTESALSAILRGLRSDGLLDPSVGGTGRRQLARDLEKFIQIDTPYGKPIRSISLPTNSGNFDWDIVHPAAALNLLCQKVPQFAAALSAALRKRPSSPSAPWQVIYYCDEATGGNLLATDPSKKAILFYYSFKELEHLLSHESCWLLAGVLRVSNAEQIDGGLSAIFACHLKALFAGYGNLRDGITIHSQAEVLVLCATLRLTLADEDALKKLWSFKGASGMRPCGKCLNVVNVRTGLEYTSDDVLVDTRCVDSERFIKHTNDTIWKLANRLADVGLTVTARQTLETRLGIVHHPRSVLLDATLRDIARPADCLFYDFQHCHLCGGCLNIELFLLLERCRDAGLLDYPDVFEELASWVWPSCVSTPPYKLCNRKHAHSSMEAGQFKGGASDLLNFHPIFRDMIIRKVKPHGLNCEVESFMLLCKVLDGFKIIQAGGIPQHWQEVTEAWFEAYQAAYDVVPKPKHHWAMHMEEQRSRESMLPTCFPLERKHKSYKRLVAYHTQMKNFEKSMSLQLLNDQIRDLRDGAALRPLTHLVLPNAGSPELARVVGATQRLQISRSARHHQVTTSIGDMVFVRPYNQVVEVRLHMYMEPHPRGSAGFCVLVTPYAKDGTLYRSLNYVALVPIDAIIAPACWQTIGNCKRVLTPSVLSYNL